MEVLKIEGELIHLSKEEIFGTDFNVKQLVIKTDEQYPQELIFQLSKSKTSLLTEGDIGKIIVVYFNMKGKKNKDRWFNTLAAWKIEIKDLAY